MSQLGRFLYGGLVYSSRNLFIGTRRKYNRDLQEANRRTSQGVCRLQMEGGTVEFADRGSGTPVLLVHGASGGFDQGLFLAELMGTSARSLSVSRFGYLGSSLPEDPSPAAQAQVFVRILDELGLEQVPAVGISAGGPPVLEFALRFPDRCSGVILVSAVTRRLNWVKALKPFCFLLRLPSDFPGWLMINGFKPALLLGHGITPAHYREMGQEGQQVYDRVYEQVLPLTAKSEGITNDMLQISSLADLPLESIRPPTLIFHSRDDNLVPWRHARDCADRIPNSRLVEFEKGGHLLLGHTGRIREEINRLFPELDMNRKTNRTIQEEP
jgi:pimeloyl-ACP methyl ester carboxylesterase